MNVWRFWRYLTPKVPACPRTRLETLAGRATSNRPNVAIWDYQRYADDHADVSMEDLIEVRFPVVFFGGDGFTIDSAAEYLRTDPVPASPNPSVSKVVEMWSVLHAAGVVRWDAQRRAVEHVKPLEEYRTVLRQWHAEQRNTPIQLARD